MFFVILTFSEHHVEHFMSLLKRLPSVGDKLQALFQEFFNEQKRRLHRSPGDKISEQVSQLNQLFKMNGYLGNFTFTTTYHLIHCFDDSSFCLRHHQCIRQKIS